MTKVYITTPIYYVNNKPHLGHAYTTISADVLARYYRQKLGENNVFFLTGTDEHGTKIEESAKKSGKTLKNFCFKNSQAFKHAWNNLNISNDYFIRTTDKRHYDSVAKLMRKLYDKGDIYEGVYEGLYCIGCEKFLTKKELVKDKCPYHQDPPKKIAEKNYFFKLKKYLTKVQKAIESNRIKVLPNSRKKEILGIFKKGLEDFSISREKVKWGIPLPFDAKQKIYVWIEALQNYISAIGYGDNKEKLKNHWQNSYVIHLMAKDIIKFHTIFWPAILLASDLKLPEIIFAHGFFTVNGKKMSKSTGNTIDPNHLLKTYDSDAIRYLLLSQFPFGADGDIKIELFLEKYNADLAHGIGNLFERIFSLAKRFNGEFDYRNTKKIDRSILVSLIIIEKHYNQHIENYKLYKALRDIFSFIKKLDMYIDNKKPWILYEKNDPNLQMVLDSLLFGLKKLIMMIKPFMPKKACRAESYMKKINNLKTRKALNKLNLFPVINNK